MLQRSLTSFCLSLAVLAITASAAFGQMPRPDTTNLLSASDLSEEQIQTAARIAASVQATMRPERMKMRKKMKQLQQKYGNPQEMDSTQKANAKREMRRQQMKMRKKQMKVVRKETKKAGMDQKMFLRIMRSARQDSTLRKELQTAMKAQMKQQQSQQQNPQNQ